MLTSALYTSLSGMNVASKGLAITANNISNAMTPNYTRPNESSINLENEVINLTRFTTAYKANAKMVSVVQDMYQVTLDMLG